MGIIGYQIVIALIIIIASFFGRSALGIVVFLAIIWTVTHVFVPWLMAIQFMTIGVSSLIGLLISATINGVRNFIQRLDTKSLIKRSKKDDANALYQLGQKYEYGKGVEYDKEKAIEYYSRAENLGHAEAKSAKERAQNGCFIISVCLAESNFLVLNNYRDFRDQVLIKSFYGRKFVGYYYQYGPKIASLIKKYSVLRKPLSVLIIFIHDSFIQHRVFHRES
jgi:hypothetical protein